MTRAARLNILAPRGSDRRNIILACREQRCLWEPWAPWYVSQTRTGRRCWERRQRCLNGCDSVRVMRVSPNDTMEDWGTRRIRPKDWWEWKGFLYGSARRERIAEQLRTTGIEAPA